MSKLDLPERGSSGYLLPFKALGICSLMRRTKDSFEPCLEQGIRSKLMDSSLAGVKGPHEVVVVIDEAQLLVLLLLPSEHPPALDMKSSLAAADVLLLTSRENAMREDDRRKSWSRPGCALWLCLTASPGLRARESIEMLERLKVVRRGEVVSTGIVGRCWAPGMTRNVTRFGMGGLVVTDSARFA